MNELYWISIIGKLNILFWFGFAVSVITIVISFIVYANAYDYEDDRALCKKVIKLGVIVMTICGLCGTITPCKSDAYVIYGAGTIVDYCKDNPKVKEIPDKAVDALNRYLDSISGSDSVLENKKDEKCQ